MTAELGFDIGVLKGTVGTEREAQTPQNERVNKCLVLERYIKQVEKWAAPGSGSNWIAGAMIARLFCFHAPGFLLQGRTDSMGSPDSVVLTLSGSNRNLVGAAAPVVEMPKYLPSFGPDVIRFLSDESERRGIFSSPEEHEQSVECTVTRMGRPAWVRTLSSFEGQNNPNAQRYGFLALRLFPAYQDA